MVLLFHQSGSYFWVRSFSFSIVIRYGQYTAVQMQKGTTRTHARRYECCPLRWHKWRLFDDLWQRIYPTASEPAYSVQGKGWTVVARGYQTWRLIDARVPLKWGNCSSSFCCSGPAAPKSRRYVDTQTKTPTPSLEMDGIYKDFLLFSEHFSNQQKKENWKQSCR